MNDVAESALRASTELFNKRKVRCASEELDHHGNQSRQVLLVTVMAETEISLLVNMLMMVCGWRDLRVAATVWLAVISPLRF
jgi:hypothetical protein